MRLVKCDRCGHQFAAETAHTVLRSFHVSRDVIELDVLPAQGIHHDLCRTCRADFDAFMANQPVAQRAGIRNGQQVVT